MYLNHYNLEREPFQVTPDPSFLYLSPGHKEALASIIYGVKKKKGFVLILGAVGVGKTTVLRAYLEKAENENIKVVYIFNPSVSYNDILKNILNSLNCYPISNNNAELTSQLHEVLINEYTKNTTIVLIIDEAQNMPVDTLEKLRMLSNLETSQEKLIQIIFSAQLEFEKTLNLEELKQLKQRIAVRVIIPSLSNSEGLLYIRHRLKRAATKEVSVFSLAAIKKIIKAANGVPRVINIMCDNALISAFGYGKKKVDTSVVNEIVRDFAGQKKSFFGERAIMLSLLGVTIGILIGAVVFRVHILNDVQKSLSTTPLNSGIVPLRGEKAINSESTKKANSPAGFKKIIVRRGDTLAKLIYEVYGYVDTNMIKLVKTANPDIVDENLIVEGRRIMLPVIIKSAK